ncbi:unnamed protein product [Cladocopium goreaui]|uniref:Uncharacterized protein n=1 Tax=Cladocopium goreaui TaxID=2562237 RepID=A0A9P1G164_9DINO|nr:unnamed protein product [Cladocopium goreaui]
MENRIHHEQDLIGLLWILSKLGAPRVFLQIVILVWYTDGLFDLGEEFQWLEFFAGVANCTLYMLALVFILKQKTSDCISWFAIKCSSFTGVNRGTSKRSACNSIGDPSVYSVGMSNALLERTILLLMAVACKCGVWVLEQPGSSVLEFYPAWLHMMEYHYKLFGNHGVSRIGWWMSMYGSPTPKRQYAWSNSTAIRRLDVGTYPVPFAQRIVNIRGDLIQGRPMEPLIPSPCPLGPQILSSTPEDVEGLFATADLGSVYRYLRGGKGLQLPPHWRPYMPCEVP